MRARWPKRTPDGAPRTSTASPGGSRCRPELHGHAGCRPYARYRRCRARPGVSWRCRPRGQQPGEHRLVGDAERLQLDPPAGRGIFSVSRPSAHSVRRNGGSAPIPIAAAARARARASCRAGSRWCRRNDVDGRARCVGVEHRDCRHWADPRSAAARSITGAAVGSLLAAPLMRPAAASARDKRWRRRRRTGRRAGTMVPMMRGSFRSPSGGCRKLSPATASPRRGCRHALRQLCRRRRPARGRECERPRLASATPRSIGSGRAMLPRPRMRPQHQVGDALPGTQRQRDVAGAVGPRTQIGAVDPAERNCSVIGSAMPKRITTRRLVIV